MNPPVVLADATGLRAIALAVPASKRINLWQPLTTAVNDGAFGFPREVLDELASIARDEHVAAWALGLGRALQPFTGNIKYMRLVMSLVSDCGFESGVETLDDRESGIVGLSRVAYEYQELGRDFLIVTEDVGESPLGPTMEQLCKQAPWPYIDGPSCLDVLGLGSLL